MNLPCSTICLLLFIWASSLTPNAVSLDVFQEIATGHFKFEPRTSGRTMKRGQIEVSFSTFTSEDGVLVERFVEDHKTAPGASVALQEECKHSLKISQDGYIYDAHGKRIGRRVEMLFLRTKNAAESIEIAWTSGPLLYLLRSKSRRHLLDFEQQVYPLHQQKLPQ
jgi:hypothetical protein